MELHNSSRLRRLGSTMMAAVLITLAGLGTCQAKTSLDLNTATVKQLEQLDGVGPVRAKAIVSYRQSHHGFQSVDELTAVKGIGGVTLSHLRDAVRVTGHGAVTNK